MPWAGYSDSQPIESQVSRPGAQEPRIESLAGVDVRSTLSILATSRQALIKASSDVDESWKRHIPEGEERVSSASEL
jgi:hypothetical protein